MKQLNNLVRLELCNMYGLNTLRYTKDPAQKRKSILFAVVLGFVFVVLMGYLVALCVGLAMLGVADVIPAYLLMICGLVILVFDVFKMGGTLFRKKGYDMLAALPVSNLEIAASRFVRLYVEGIMVAGLVMLPGIVVYAVFVHPGAGFYAAALFGTISAPLLPLAIAVLLGGVITGISSRMKNKALAEMVLSIALVLVAMAGSAMLGIHGENMTADMWKNLSGVVMDTIKEVYPPAALVGSAIVSGKVGACIGYTAVTLLLYGIMLLGVAAFFEPICRGLHTTVAKHDYELGQLEQRSLLKTMVVREAKRYFSSGPYVSNTIIGPVLAMVGSIALIFVDMEKMTAGMPAVLNVSGAVPFVIGAVFAMMNTTSVSISMEGKEWWIVKSLPISTKIFLDGKMLLGLGLNVPFYLVSVVALWIALRPDLLGAVWIVLIPLLIILFSTVFGITANLHFPKMDWENEVTVVKQSASALLGMVSALVAFGLAIPVLAVPALGIPGLDMTEILVLGMTTGEICAHLVCLAESVLLAIVTVILYKRNSRIDLMGI